MPNYILNPIIFNGLQNRKFPGLRAKIKKEFEIGDFKTVNKELNRTNGICTTAKGIEVIESYFSEFYLGSKVDFPIIVPVQEATEVVPQE